MATAIYGHFAGGHVEVIWAPSPDDSPARGIWWFWYQVLQAVLHERLQVENAVRHAAWYRRRPAVRRWQVVPWARAVSAFARMQARRPTYGEVGDIDWFGGGAPF
jgi:hypothetical protein